MALLFVLGVMNLWWIALDVPTRLLGDAQLVWGDAALVGLA